MRVALCTAYARPCGERAATALEFRPGVVPARPTIMYLNATAAEPVVATNAPVYVDAVPEPKLASVSHVALDAIAAAIWGSPFYDTEFLVKHKGKDQSLFLHSNVVKAACPVLYKSTSFY